MSLSAAPEPAAHVAPELRASSAEARPGREAPLFQPGRFALVSLVVEYQLFLVTSSQAVQAIKSRDPEWIDGLRDRIEGATARRLD